MRGSSMHVEHDLKGAHIIDSTIPEEKRAQLTESPFE